MKKKSTDCTFIRLRISTEKTKGSSGNQWKHNSKSLEGKEIKIALRNQFINPLQKVYRRVNTNNGTVVRNMIYSRQYFNWLLSSLTYFGHLLQHLKIFHLTRNLRKYYLTVSSTTKAQKLIEGDTMKGFVPCNFVEQKVNFPESHIHFIYLISMHFCKF